MKKYIFGEEEKGYIEAYLGDRDGSALIRMNEGNIPKFSLSAFLFTFIAFSRKKMRREACVCFALMLIVPLAAGIFAGTAAMLGEGMEITPGAVYSELRRIPVTAEHAACRCSGIDTVLLSRYVPQYLLMLDPLINTADYDFTVNSVPAFYFGLFRMIAVFAVSAVCGVFFYRLYFRHIRRKHNFVVSRHCTAVIL